jgi:chondroitin AC lyase
MKLRPHFLLPWLLLVFGAETLQADDFTSVVDRYRSLLIGAPATVREIPPVSDWLSAQTPDGAWPDIDYGNTNSSAWPALEHLRRTRELTRALVRPGSSWTSDVALERTALAAIGHWNLRRYQNRNWWQNEIGVPQVMRDIIVLLGDRLQGKARAEAMAVLRQFRLLKAGDGANTIWSAELALLAGALERDQALMDEAARLFAGEIRIGGGQGIQDDYSFHQHGPRLQQFHYGLSYLQGTVRVAWLLHDTPWAVSSDRIRLLAALMEEGTLWMCRGRATVPGTLDRAVSRPGNLAPAILDAELTLLADLLPERAADFARWRQRLDDGQPVHEGFRAFPDSDFAAYHRPEFSFFLKTISTRTETTEMLLKENLRGRKLNWGDHYFVTNEEAYTDLPPVWDWELLPGVTFAPDLDTIHRQEFVGALGDGETGAVVMDQVNGREGARSLTTKKFWAMRDGVVIGLMGNLQRHAAGEPVRTALDQRRLRGVVTVADAGGVSELTAGHHQRSSVRWVHHDGLLYVPVGDAAISFRLGPVSGAWRDINANRSDQPVTESVFLAVQEHGACTDPVSSGFVVLACATPVDATTLLAEKRWTIVHNDAAVQAVRFSDGGWMGAFHAGGSVEIRPGHRATVDAPCLLLFADGLLRACDPTHVGRVLQVTVDDVTRAVTCPPEGRSSSPVAFHRDQTASP